MDMMLAHSHTQHEMFMQHTHMLEAKIDELTAKLVVYDHYRPSNEGGAGINGADVGYDGGGDDKDDDEDDDDEDDGRDDDDRDDDDDATSLT